MSNRVRRILIRRALAFLAATTLVVAAGWTASTAGAETGITIFVSPAGDDANPGTETLPIRTLTRARDLVRTMNASLTADLTVRLADGTYRLAAPLALSALDSGSGGHRVVWTAAPGAHPVVSGGVRVTGWTLTDATRNLWSASAPAVLANTRQLYVDGHRAARAAGRLPVSLTQTTTGYTASADTMSRWRNPSDLEFVYTGGNSLWSYSVHGVGPWTEPRCPVGSISGTAVTMAQPCWDNSTKRADNHVGGSNVGTPQYVENAFELLDQPGEWYFDRGAGRIYYLPRPGESLGTADVEAPLLETLLSGSGTTTSLLHDVTFSGIQFSYATWLLPSTGEGFSEIQANYTLTGAGAYATQGLCQLVAGGTCPFGAWSKIHNNVWFTNARGVQLLDDVFAHLGGSGPSFGNGVQDSVVKGCVFTDISGNGLRIGDVTIVSPTTGQATTGNTVTDNYFTALPVEYHGGVGIFVGYAQNTVISHNQIDHTAYSAISLGWGGWLQKIQQPAQPNPARNNQVTNNLIFDHMQVLSDGGGIYTNGVVGTSLADGEKLIGNVMHDQFGSGKTLYTDNGASYITMKSNVLADNDYRDWGTKQFNYGLNDNGPMDVEGNWWQMGDKDTGANNVTVAGNHVIRSISQAPSSIVDSSSLEPAYLGLLDRRFGTGVPDAPSQVAARAGNGFAYVAWCPPVDHGGTPVTSYTVTASNGSRVTVTAADFRTRGYVKMTGLTNGTGYRFTVTATNATGTGAASLASSTVTPSATAVSVPSAPQSVSAVAGNGRATVRFALPSSTGGSPIISYTIRGGGQTVVVTGRTVLVLTGGTHFHYGVVEGLTNGQSYTFTVTAENAAGSSPGTTSTSVTPNSSA